MNLEWLEIEVRETFAVWRDSQGWHERFPDDIREPISEQACRELIEHILEEGWERAELSAMEIAERTMRAADSGLIVILGLPELTPE